jgi:UDP-N-acetylmuramate dehydrogenase
VDNIGRAVQPLVVVETDVSLAPLTTLELGGRARHFVRAPDDEAVMQAVAWANARGLPLVVLGGGSNVVVSDAGVEGLVLKIATRGVRFEEGGLVTAVAGEPWDELVGATVARGWAGLECLTGIPGLVGATPIQNVGAYGQDVAETIREVRALDRRTGQVAILSRDACAFGYRDSLFRRRPDDYIVLGVTFALRPGGPPAVRYPELERALDGRERVSTPEARSLPGVAATVRALRARKSMLVDASDPNRRSAGSFFTNPVLDVPAFDAFAARTVAAGVVTRPEEIPRFEAGGGRLKIPAAWLIERAGFTKGLRRGQVGISSAHALALVHHGGGTTDALLALAQEIRDAVQARFGVTLEREPVLIGGPSPTRPLTHASAT